MLNEAVRCHRIKRLEHKLCDSSHDLAEVEATMHHRHNVVIQQHYRQLAQIAQFERSFPMSLSLFLFLFVSVFLSLHPAVVIFFLK